MIFRLNIRLIFFMIFVFSNSCRVTKNIESGVKNTPGQNPGKEAEGGLWDTPDNAGIITREGLVYPAIWDGGTKTRELSVVKRDHVFYIPGHSVRYFLVESKGMKVTATLDEWGGNEGSDFKTFKECNQNKKLDLQTNTVIGGDCDHGPNLGEPHLKMEAFGPGKWYDDHNTGNADKFNEKRPTIRHTLVYPGGADGCLATNALWLMRISNLGDEKIYYTASGNAVSAKESDGCKKCHGDAFGENDTVANCQSEAKQAGIGQCSTLFDKC